MEIVGATFRNNTSTSDDGGGIHNDGVSTPGDLTITNSLFDGISAKFGGGISTFGGTVTIVDSTISGNQANQLGGGIDSSHEAHISLNNVSVSDNQAAEGGGVHVANGTVSVNHSTLDANTAGQSGGGIYNSGDVSLTNSTISGNNSTDGGGVQNRGTLVIEDSTIAGPECDTLTSAGNNLIGSSADCSLSSSSGDIVDVDPGLGSLTDNGGATHTHALLPGSLAIDAGNTAVVGGASASSVAALPCEATDQRGVSRPIDGDGDGVAICDIGAYEIDPPVGLVVFASQRTGNWDIYVADANGPGQTNLTNTAEDEISQAWCSDGSKIAYNTVGDSEIYVMSADGSAKVNLSNNAAQDQSARWSPDGGKIAFSSNRDGNFEIYVMNADGSNQTRLTNNSARDQFPAWSVPVGTLNNFRGGHTATLLDDGSVLVTGGQHVGGYLSSVEINVP